jgi:hypothetical protein
VLGDLIVVAAEAVSVFLDEPGPFGQKRLRLLADAYNLLAFVQESSDVQRVVRDMFRRGRIVVDASILLPSFAETLAASERRPYTTLIRLASKVGLRLEVTDGVLNELESHLKNGIRCERLGAQYKARTPYVLERWRGYAIDGSFADFVSRFMGENPVQDLADYLRSELGVHRLREMNLESRVPETTRWEFVEVWRRLKGQQRRDADPAGLDLLLAHDIEMYFGTLSRRASETDAGPFGYQSWFLTTDWTAFRVREVARAANVEIDSDPCMHPNFMTNLLAIGPARQEVEPDVISLLPIAVQIQERGLAVPLLSVEIERIRRQYANMPEYFLRRKMRERVQELKREKLALSGDALDWDLSLTDA